MPRWSGRHPNAVPLKRTVFLDSPRIGLVGPIFRKGERTKRYPAHIEIFGRDLVSPLHIMQFQHKPHNFFHPLVRKIRIPPIFTEQFDPIGHGGLLPAIIIDAELIKHTITVAVFRDLPAD